MTQITNKISRKFLRIRLQNHEIYSFVKQITTLISSVYNIPLVSIYAGAEELRFFGVSVNKEAFQDTLHSPIPEDFQFLPPLLKSRDSLSYKEFKLRDHSFVFSGMEFVLLYIADQNQLESIANTFKDIEDQIALLLLPMIQDEDWIHSNQFKESLQIANQYIQSFPFLQSLLQLVLNLVQKYSKAEYLTIQYHSVDQPESTTISYGKHEGKKYNQHTYSVTEYGFFVQITLYSLLPFPNTPIEVYRMNRCCRLTAKLISYNFTKTEDYYLESHITFTKIYHTLLTAMPDQLDQMLAIGQSFAIALKLSIPESYALQWLIVLDTVGSMSLQLFTRAGNQPWEMDFSSLVKKTIIENLSVPIRYPSIISIDKNLFHSILNCVRAYPQFTCTKSLHSSKAMLEEIRKLEIPENFIPIYLQILTKNNQKKCFEIIHCSKEFREICPVYKQHQNKKNSVHPCCEVEHLRNELLGIQCKQCMIKRVQEENHAKHEQ
ncbi:MAG TPA: hypothetical protein PLE09_00920 [Caldisericia bacterium]|nr:hypothetical protein [Caldisericia bacterium]HXK51101.1 hypothetical protein [Caldisericia bacterium]